MSGTRQRFLWALALAALALVALVLVVALPLLADAALEAGHDLLRLCRHPFRPHYMAPETAVAVLLVVPAVVLLARFTRGALLIAGRTHAATGRLLVGRLPVLPEWIAAVAAAAGVNGRLDVIEASERLAFCHGLLRPRIVLSMALCAILDHDELTAVLLHEDHHRRRREPLRIVLLGALAHALSFMPPVGVILGQARTEMEIAADRAAVARTGSTRALARALLKVLPPAGEAEFFDSPALAVSALSAAAARIDALGGGATATLRPLGRGYFAAVGGPLISGLAGLYALAAQANLHGFVHGCHLT